MTLIVVFLSSILIFSVFSTGNSLSLNYYDKTCPHAESIITNAVKTATSKDKTVPAALLRLHFHDCFVRVTLQSITYPPKLFIFLIIYFNSSCFFFFVFFSFIRAVMPPCCYTQKGTTKQKKMGHLMFPCMHCMSLTMQRKN